MTPDRQYRCHVCGQILNAWLPAAQRSNGAMLLHYLGDRHPQEVGPYLRRMETEDIATVAAEVCEVIEEQSGSRGRST